MIRSFLISEVISFSKEALKLSRRLFPTLEDFALEGPAMLALADKRFPILLVKLNLHLHSLCSPVDCFFSFDFLLSTSLEEKVQLWIFYLTLNSSFNQS